MRKKGQAAMEFLMTYGWAILAAVIVIGVLASFGVFSPSKYVSTSCMLSAPFGCDKNQVAATTTDITVVIRNGGGESMDVSDITVDGCGSLTLAVPVSVGDQDTYTAVVTCDAPLTSESKFSGDITVTYTPTDGGVIDLTSSGSIVVKVA